MPDDRDQLFEKAIARHLRADGTAETLCLDAETLAAYHERTLSPEEMSAAKSHIAACARCQEILAHLETTEEIAGAADARWAEQETAPALAAAKPAAPAIREKSLVAASPTPSAPPQKLTSIAAKRSFSLRWAVPAGAIAAGLLLLIGLREFRLAAPKQSPGSAQVAENRASVPAPQESSEALRAVEQDKPQRKKEEERQALQKSAPAAAPMSRAENSVRDEKDSSDRVSLGKVPQPSAKVRRSPAIIPRQHAAGPNVTAGQAQAADAIQQSAPAINGRASLQGEIAPKEKKVAPQAPVLDDSAARTPAKAGIGGGQGAGNGPAPAPAPPPPPAALKRTPGLLRGTVTDPSGAAIAGANVVLKSSNGGTVASTSSDSGGAYSFDGVSAGNYQLELQSPGFKTDTLSGLNVAPGENVVNARLEVGISTETVEVTGQAAAVVNSQATEVTAAPKMKGKNLQALLLASSGLQTTTSPDGKAVWKFGEMGHILHSRNAGKDWTLEASGVAVKLLAASAPNAKVCWIAGAAGTLLRTTDGGKHWQPITTPITGDLGGVHAADARHASIWDAPNHITYETTDGGATWKQRANE